MNRELLEQPFDPALIKTRKGNRGQRLSYVEGAEYIRRLNEAFVGDWSFEVVEHRIIEAEVVVVGKLSAGGTTKMAFGGGSITIAQSGKPICLADDLKAGATDALKKACSLLGIGLHLYSEPHQENSVKPSPNSPNQSSSTEIDLSSNASQTSPIAIPARQPQDPITPRQTTAIQKLGLALGWTGEDLQQRSLSRFGQTIEQLTRSEAANLISELNRSMRTRVQPTIQVAS